jgi:hypothetical protein
MLRSKGLVWRNRGDAGVMLACNPEPRLADEQLRPRMSWEKLRMHQSEFQFPKMKDLLILAAILGVLLCGSWLAGSMLAAPKDTHGSVLSSNPNV